MAILNCRFAYIRFSFVLLICASTAAFSAEVVVTDDGKQIRLNDDGTWTQVSQDKFATTASGERIRVRANGSWNYVSAPDNQVAHKPLPVVTDEVVIFLESVEILRREIKRSKSKHADTRMRYTVRITNGTDDTIAVDKDAAFRSTTNRGGDYDLLSVTGPSTVLPSTVADLIVVVADSPAWFGVKYLSLEVPPNALGNSVRRLLNKDMDEVKRLRVDQF